MEAAKAEKKPFAFNKGEPEQRVANALEFIAHYLDRIEGHLGSLAIRAETDPIGETIRHEMIEFRDFLEMRLPKID